jgi:hypothetical protein
MLRSRQEQEEEGSEEGKFPVMFETTRKVVRFYEVLA